MKNLLFTLSLSCLSLTAMAQDLQSPNGNFKMNFSLDAQGRPTYYLKYKGRDIIRPSHLGLELKQEDPNKAQDFEFKTRADASKLAQKADLYDRLRGNRPYDHDLRRDVATRLGRRKQHSQSLQRTLRHPLTTQERT